MNGALGVPSQPPNLEQRAAKPRFAAWLALGAAPTFAVMGLVTALPHAGPMSMTCPTAFESPLNGMGAMYLLMSAFHLPPWLTRFSRRRAAPLGSAAHARR